jgi:hypothetical protein
MTRDSLRQGPKPLLRRGIGTRSGSSGCAERRWSVNQSAVRSIVPSIDAPQTLQVRTTIGRGWLVATARSVRSHWPLIFTIAASVASALRANSLNSLRIARGRRRAKPSRLSVCESGVEASASSILPLARQEAYRASSVVPEAAVADANQQDAHTRANSSSVRMSCRVRQAARGLGGPGEGPDFRTPGRSASGEFGAGRSPSLRAAWTIGHRNLAWGGVAFAGPGRELSPLP